MAKVTMPQLGESVAEGTIGKWLKKPGDRVEKYEPLLEVITDKVNAEVPSPFEGTLKEILVEEGQTVPNNAEIAVIEEAGEATGAEPESAAPQPTAQAAPQPSPVPSQGSGIEGETPAAQAGYGPAGSDERSVEEIGGGDGVPRAPVGSPSTGTPTAALAAPEPSTSGRDPVPVMDEQATGAEGRMTPAVRRLLREHALDASQIKGTGHGGRITREDVMNVVEAQRTGGAAAQQVTATPQPAAAAPQPAAAAPQPAAAAPQPTAAPEPTAAPQATAPAPEPTPAPVAPAPVAPVSTTPAWASGQDEELVPLNQMRRGIANQMTRANAVPVAYSTFECDMTAVAKLREKVAPDYKAREGVGLSYLPFVVKAVVEALKRTPDLNAHYTDQGLLRKRRINIGIAVAVDNGLIVPVVHDADQLSINGLNRAIQDLAGRARASKLRLDDLQGSTFTIDNTGWFGSIVSSPIINTPEVCILTTEAVVKRPIVRETPEGDTIAIRSMMNLCAGFDHRATDGAQIGRFVNDVIHWLESVTPELPIY